jgi:hypothetical protein
MAINLSKDKTPKLIYYSQEKKKMKFLLFMTIFMIAATSLLMFLGFYLLPVSLFNLLFISLMTCAGYIAGLLYYNNYLTIKKKKNAGNY